ncbi:MAG: hypothetical protein K2J88_06955, partial [Oscillospiraceae bacterium]|nr:hypothetical protein [Oscillospiraceae bacterium]
DEQTEEMICNMFGVEPQKPTEVQQQTPAPDNSTTPDMTSPDNSATQSDRIAPAEFINMTLDEKINYVNTLEENQRSEFLSSLSREERNSIIKQLPTDQKMTLMQNYIDTASAMGMNVVVDSVTDNNISLTVRDNEGIIIDKADVGIVIDETGISHTKPLAFAGLGILTAVAGFGLLYWYSKRTEQE